MQSFYLQGVISIIIVCLVALFLAGFHRETNRILTFVKRGVTGFICMVLLNKVFIFFSIPLSVGINLWTLLTGAVFGIPGVCMLFCIGLF